MKTAHGVKKQGRPELDEIDIKKLPDLVKESIREGKTGKEISQNLGVSVRALRRMLSGAGISLVAIRMDIRRESLANVSEQIDNYFTEHPTSIPEGAEEKWVERGSAKSLERYRKAFFMMLGGMNDKQIARELRSNIRSINSIKRVILPEVEQQRRAEAEAIFGFLERPGLTEREIEVFKLVTVEWLSNKDARDRLDINESRVGQIVHSLERKIPALTKFFSARRHHSETIEKMGARQEKRKVAMGQLDEYLETRGPKKLRNTIRSRSIQYADPVGCAQTIVNAWDEAEKEIHRTNFPRRYRKAAIGAIASYGYLYHNPIQAVTTLREIARLADEEMDRQGIPRRYRTTIFRSLVLDKKRDSIIDRNAVMERIAEIKTTRDSVMEDLDEIDAPVECKGRIASVLMYLKQPIKELKERARTMVGTYEDLKSDIMKKDHPEIVAKYIGVSSLTRGNPLDDWKKELDGALKREYRYVKRREYVEKIGLTDTEFLALVDKSRRDDDTAKMELVKRFMPIIGHFKQREKVPENKLLFLQILNDLPKENYSGHPLQDFTTYVAYAVRINSIRLSRIERSWDMYVRDGDEGYGGIENI